MNAEKTEEKAKESNDDSAEKNAGGFSGEAKISEEEKRKHSMANQSEAVPYDLSSQDRIIRGRMPTLEIIHDRLVRMFRITLSSALRKPVDISVRSTELMKFGAFQKSLTVPSSLTLFRMNPLQGTSILVLTTDLVMRLVDIFYGSTGDLKVELEGRDFTLIEHELIRRVAIAFLADMEIAWRPVFPVQMSYQRQEINPMFTAIVPRSEVVILVTFDLEFGSQSIENVLLCVPYSTLVPIRSLLDSGFQSDQANFGALNENRVQRNLKEIKLNLTAKTSGKDLSVRSLINLKEGDYLLSDRKADQPIDIFINGIKKMTGLLKEEKGRQTIEVAEIFEAHVHDEIEELRKRALKLKGDL
ncbi:MAG: flagellar motor switch protein FliM [Proteobacteria bacterium]|nr:flagellar motor switch protein FliM [Pseudomonadota bacterium]